MFLGRVELLLNSSNRRHYTFWGHVELLLIILIGPIPFLRRVELLLNTHCFNRRYYILWSHVESLLIVIIGTIPWFWGT